MTASPYSFLGFFFPPSPRVLPFVSVWACICSTHFSAEEEERELRERAEEERRRLEGAKPPPLMQVLFLLCRVNGEGG